MTTWSHVGRRATAPRPRPYTRSSAICDSVPQWAHVPRASVISLPKCSYSCPAIAFPSTASIVTPGVSRSGSRGAEAFSPDASAVMSGVDEPLRCGLDEPTGAAHVDQRTFLRRPDDLGEQVAVDAPAMALPV